MSKEVVFQNHINQKKEFHELFIQYIDSENESDYFEELVTNIHTQEIPKNLSELKLLILFLIDISNNHHRCPNFFAKLIKLIQYFERDIKQTLTNYEIFDLIKSNKIIFLNMIKRQVITIDNQITSSILSMNHQKDIKYCHFFYPEINKFLDEKDQKMIENELLEIDSNIFDDFEESRMKAENNSRLCTLIRDDLIEDFIIYVNKTNISLTSTIKQSIFETNSLLLDQSPTLIEYAAFFGSIQIFQYLTMKGVELTQSLWIYAIHSNNPEIIQCLLENNLNPPNETYETCFLESIKCHHNEMANYIYDNLLNNTNEEQYNDEAIVSIIKHYNYAYFPLDFNRNIILPSLIEYEYLNTVQLYLKLKEDLINQNKIYFYFYTFSVCELKYFMEFIKSNYFFNIIL